MIVSHRHRFIFFAVPRTGSHAVRGALADALGPDDWRQEALAEDARLPIPELARIGHGHISLRQAQAALPSGIWRDYVKFAFVRDPFDRFVSACAMLNRRNPDYPGRERAFMQRALGVPRFRRRVLVRPQTELLCDAAGAVGMDCIGRYETLQSSFDAVCARIGIPARTLPRRNAAAQGEFRAVYDAELAAAVASFYRSDFERFGYPDTLCD